MGIQVIATERCHDGTKFIEVGETFTVPDDTFDARRQAFNEYGHPILDDKGEPTYYVNHLPAGYKPADPDAVKAKKVKAAKPVALKAETDLA